MNNSKAVNDIMKILSLFSDEVGEMGVSEIAKKCGFFPSKVQRILNTFVSGGFLEKNPESKKYRIGLRLFEISSSYISHLSIRDIVRPYAEVLASKFESNVHLALMSAKNAIIVDRIQNLQSPASIYRVSINVPLNCSSVGKVLLAELREDHKRAIINSLSLKKYTPKTITDSKTLEKHLIQVKKQGYAVDTGELHDNVYCVASPIRDRNSDVIAALSISGSKDLLEENKFKSVVSELTSVTNFISRQLGSSG